MKLSNGVETGIHCTAVLAGLKGDATLPALALAEYYGVSPTYLLKHLGRLTEAGILESVPGPSGGYRLARSADEISLAAIIAAIEGPVRLTLCSEDRERAEETRCVSCTLVQRCPVTTGIRTVNDRIVSFLRQVTLQDLLRCELKGFPELHQVSTSRRLSIGIPRP